MEPKINFQIKVRVIRKRHFEKELITEDTFFLRNPRLLHYKTDGESFLCSISHDMPLIHRLNIYEVHVILRWFKDLGIVNIFLMLGCFVHVYYWCSKITLHYFLYSFSLHAFWNLGSCLQCLSLSILGLLLYVCFIGTQFPVDIQFM